jgi:hypothetical protein
LIGCGLVWVRENGFHHLMERAGFVMSHGSWMGLSFWAGDIWWFLGWFLGACDWVFWRIPFLCTDIRIWAHGFDGYISWVLCVGLSGQFCSLSVAGALAGLWFFSWAGWARESIAEPMFWFLSMGRRQFVFPGCRPICGWCQFSWIEHGL